VYNRPAANYRDNNEPAYNPYAFTSGHDDYRDNHYAGYRDDTFVPPSENPPISEKHTSGPSRAIPSTRAPRDKSSGAVHSWRQSEHGNLWNKGSRARCCGRFFCCTLMTLIVLIASILATLALWIGPPNVTFNGVNFSDPSNKVSMANGGFVIPLTLNISVDNPNYFSATFNNISAVATYPGTSVSVGGGHMANVKFPSHTTAYIQFPFSVQYQVSNDPGLTILKDLATKCGATSDITVNYDLTLKIRIIALISPSFSSSASFPCPLTPAEIQSIGGGLLGGSS